MRRIARDDHSAFNEFYELYYSRLYQYTSFYIQDEACRKDIISDVFVSIWHNRHNMDKIQNIENYLYISVKNRSMKHLKEASERQYIQIRDVEESELIDRNGPEQKLITGELQDLIEQSIRKLPERCRLIFTLIRGEKKTYKEVAALLNISEKTVHAQMCIAIKRLGTLINRYK